MKEVSFALKFFNITATVLVERVKMKDWGEVEQAEGHYILKLKKGLKGALLRRVIWHECVHIKQYEQDGLFFSEELMMFRGERWLEDNYYWFPWEIEARGMEEALEHEWHTRKKKKKHLKNTQEPQLPSWLRDSKGPLEVLSQSSVAQEFTSNQSASPSPETQ
jgi:hypothetical protein